MASSLQLVYIFLIFVLDSTSLATMPDTSTVISVLNFTKHPTSRSVSRPRVRTRYLEQHFSSFSSNIPIILHNGGFVIPLSFGTPQHTFYVILDTASSLTWLPCSRNFTKDIKKKEIFYPSLSSSSRYLQCNNPKSRWFGDRRAHYQCEEYKAHAHCSTNCSKPLHYNLSYITGSTSGILLSETLYIPNHTAENFIVGCSNSTPENYGLVGFGRNLESFPSQLGIKRFSYCVLGGHLIDKSPTSYLVLNDESHSEDISYTPFHKNPSNYDVSDLYYVILEAIIIGNKSINIPRKFLAPKANENYGTIVDSGSTFTYVHISIFNEVVREFREQLGMGALYPNNKVTKFCFDLSKNEASTLPNMTFQFKDGAMMKVAWQNYLVDLDSGLKCLAVRAINFPIISTIILGNTIMQDFYVEFDLEKERFGFLANKCA